MRRILLIWIALFAVSLVGCQTLSKISPGKKASPKGKPAAVKQSRQEAEEFRKAVEKDPFPTADALGL